MNLNNILLFFFLVIFSCKVGENVSESEAIYCVVSFKSLKSNIGSSDQLKCDKVSVLCSLKSKKVQNVIGGILCHQNKTGLVKKGPVFLTLARQ